MSLRVWAAAAVTAGIALVIYTAHAADKPAGKSAAPPPLKVDKSAPLLLGDTAKPADKTTAPKADNGPCYVCHTNYEEEPFAQWHAKANVGCMKCHGESSAHRNDEDNITPPDKMYWPARIESCCKECHDEHNAPAVKVIARWQQRCPNKTNPKDIVCTDCHGEHRLKTRNVRWDKQTRKVLPKEEPHAK